MFQSILVGLIFIAAMIYLGRFIFRQINAGKDETSRCDKCLPEKNLKGLKRDPDPN